MLRLPPTYMVRSMVPIRQRVLPHSARRFHPDDFDVEPVRDGPGPGPGPLSNVHDGTVECCQMRRQSVGPVRSRVAHVDVSHESGRGLIADASPTRRPTPPRSRDPRRRPAPCGRTPSAPTRSRHQDRALRAEVAARSQRLRTKAHSASCSSRGSKRDLIKFARR